MVDWIGKVMVVTGAASGIGAGLVRCGFGRGMRVVAADVDEASLAVLRDSFGEHGTAPLFRAVDVSDATAVEQLAAEVFDLYGEVNLLFNNAGVLVSGKSWERSLQDWQWSLNVNVMGVVHGIRSFVPRMLRQGTAGRIINTSSIGGLLGGSAFLAPYQGSKHFVTAITESLYHELALEDAPISASVLCPGDVATGIFESRRLRPGAGQQPVQSDAEQQLNTMLAANVAQGMHPDEFARRCFAAIEQDRFWLLPQPEFKPLFEARSDSVLAGSNPLSTQEMMQRFFSPEQE